MTARQQLMEKSSPWMEHYSNSLKVPTHWNQKHGWYPILESGFPFYKMAGIFGTAYVRTSTQDKVINGFKSCGLWPFDNNIFLDDDFVS